MYVHDRYGSTQAVRSKMKSIYCRPLVPFRVDGHIYNICEATFICVATIINVRLHLYMRGFSESTFIYVRATFIHVSLHSFKYT